MYTSIARGFTRFQAHRLFSSRIPAGIQVSSVGTLGSLDFRLSLKSSNGNVISAWHDLPAYADDKSELLTFVNEIPKGTDAKMEVSKSETGNPIKQDVKGGKPRIIKYGKYPWNYGMVPQTYEDPNVIDPVLQLKGDDDPIDVVEISGTSLPMGAVIPVRPLGVLGLIDEGECDYKIIAIDARIPNAEKIQSWREVPQFDEDQLSEWYRLYKTAEGKGPNRFAFGVIRSKKHAMEIVKEAHEAWIRLRAQTA